ncbi:hypothetical protein WME91_47255 [Sorangium sp. So ce269]
MRGQRKRRSAGAPPLEALYRQCYQQEQDYLRMYPPIASTIVSSGPMQPRYVSASP